MFSARLLLVLLTACCLGGCMRASRSKPTAGIPPAYEPLAPSPRLIVGRVQATDVDRRFAFVDLAADAPDAALAEGTELVCRSVELRETGRLRVSRYVRGRTLGATMESGEPNVGDEVVWLAP
jgi:hypothetical protein